MSNLLAFLSRHFHWLLFLFLEAVSVVMLFSYNNYQRSVWISSANVIAGKFYEGQSYVEHFFSLTRQNEGLTLRNAFLERQVDLLREELNDLKQDSSAAAQFFKDSGLDSYVLIPAKVVANSMLNTDHLITIDKGSADGLQPDMGVVSGTGIVGVVYMVSDHYAVVISALNKRSRISCSIRNSRYFGYLSWNGNDPVYAYVEDVPRHAKFKKGDWVETSGYSSIFPHGVAVGKIEKIFNSRDGLSYRLLVHLSTDFANLRDVCVIHDKGMAERMRIEEAASDSLMLMPQKE